MQTLYQWPKFDPKVGLMPQLAKFEAAAAEYELLSGTALNDNTKLAAVLQCLTGQLKTQATVQISETSTYQDLRALIERWDASQTRWNSSLATSFGITIPNQGNQGNQGPAPMEIDRIKGKDPGKGKGKGGKGKGHKGGKGESQKGGKGKGKAKQDKQIQQQQQYQQKGGQSKGWSQKGQVECHNCGRTGHIARNCWRPKNPRVNQVAENTFQQPSVAASSAGPPSVSGVSTQAPSQVRRVRMEPLIVDLSDLDWEEGNHVNMVQFRLDSSDDDGLWDVPSSNYIESATVLTPLCNCEACDSKLLSVRAVVESADKQSVIVDSGADISCLPRAYSSAGRSVRSRPMSVQDAQGAPLQVSDERLVDFVVDSASHGPVIIRERCIISDVTQPLLSMGRLIKKGWFPCKGNGHMWLNHDATGADVNMEFRGMSLTVDAEIRRVEFVQTSQVSHHVQGQVPSQVSHQVQGQVPSQVSHQVQGQVPSQVSHQVQGQVPSQVSHQVQGQVPSQVSHQVQGQVPLQVSHQVVGQAASATQAVRAVVRAELGPTVSGLQFGWQLTDSGHLVWRGVSSRYVDPTVMASEHWPFRTTLMRASDRSPWLVIENCVEWIVLEDIEEDLPCDSMAELIVFLHVRHESLGELDLELHDSLVLPPEQASEHVDPDDLERQLEELANDDHSNVGADAKEAEMCSPKRIPDMEEPADVKAQDASITVDGVVLTLASSLQALKAACTKLELRTSGF